MFIHNVWCVYVYITIVCNGKLYPSPLVCRQGICMVFATCCYMPLLAGGVVFCNPRPGLLSWLNQRASEGYWWKSPWRCFGREDVAYPGRGTFGAMWHDSSPGFCCNRLLFENLNPWLLVWIIFSQYTGNNHPSWLSIVFRWVGLPPTRPWSSLSPQSSANKLRKYLRPVTCRDCFAGLRKEPVLKIIADASLPRSSWALLFNGGFWKIGDLMGWLEPTRRDQSCCHQETPVSISSF